MDFFFDIFEGGEVVELERAPVCRAGERDIISSFIDQLVQQFQELLYLGSTPHKRIVS